MTLLISSELVEQMLDWATASPNAEICGLLFGRFDRVESVELTPNVASNTQTRFEIDPVRLIAAHRAAREGGPPLLGCFHSHPGGALEPSACDAELADPDGSIWLILAGDKITAWRAVDGGHLHGCFDPVPILRC